LTPVFPAYTPVFPLVFFAILKKYSEYFPLIFSLFKNLGAVEGNYLSDCSVYFPAFLSFQDVL
jgi:hypothetical protein